jgi:hypothetical protein
VVPLLARVLGNIGAVLVTIAVFALLHWLASVLTFRSICGTGATD